jgi:hypothetical protein
LVVGYNETSKAYRIFILAQRKTIVSRDVKFEENLASRSTKESSAMIEVKDEQQSAIQTSNGEAESTPSSLINGPK